MLKFLSDNHEKYSFFNKKWEVVSTTKISSTHDHKVYGWVFKDTNLSKYSSKGRLSIDVENNKYDTISGWELSRTDTSDYDMFIGGIKSEISVHVRNEYYYERSILVLTKFIKKLPKQSRNKLIKIIYLYELNEVKTFNDYAKLIKRLRYTFNLKFNTFAFCKSYQFEGIKPTFEITDDRNRKINQLLKLKRDEIKNEISN